MTSKKISSAISLLLMLCVVVLMSNACTKTPTTANTAQPATANAANANTAPAKTTPIGITASPTMAGRPEQGEPVDTAKEDAEIKKLEAQLKKKPDDKAAQAALARAYFERAEALKGARQYRAALGDYRRTLRYDPENQDARQWATTITVIIQQMGREVPAEGAEPTPLPMKKTVGSKK